MRVTVALGTRPEVIKLSPVIHALRTSGAVVRVIHTGQHTDANLAGDLEHECGLAVDVRWALPVNAPDRLAAIFGRALAEFSETRADAAIVLGDTWTVPLIALAARNQGVPVIHLEAGLRSHNAVSQEEVNRKVVASIAQLHLAPTECAATALRREGVDPRTIHVTGNPVTDALRATGIARVAHARRSGVLFTAHRASNVDDEAVLTEIVNIVERLASHVDTVTFPVHPRTHDRLTKFGLWARAAQSAQLIAPLSYRDLLATLAASRLVVTDSGGLQEEAAWFAVPTIVMRSTTPRPEGVALGFARLAGVDAQRVMQLARELVTPEAVAAIDAMPCPYGDGYTADRIVEAIRRAHSSDRLRLREPEFTMATTLDQTGLAA